MRAVLTRIALAASAAVLCAGAAFAQEAATWVRSAPEGEGFSVRMPKEPASSPARAAAGALKVEGRRYEAADEQGRRYVVWSLKDPANVGRLFADAEYVSEVLRGEALYIDLVAEVAWELLGEHVDNKAQLAYAREFRLDGKPAREYTLYSKKARGPVFVCADGPRVYVVAALGANATDARLKQFVESFAPNTDPTPAPVGDPKPVGGTGGGIGPGRGSGVGTGGGVGSGAGPGLGGLSTPAAPVDYNRTFRMAEVVQKAVLTSKPEPGFTKQARKFTVTGVVRIRAVLAKTGEVRNITVIKGLPHGLTPTAVEAAGKIRFRPALKDGRVVSQYIVLEYNYNIY